MAKIGVAKQPGMLSRIGEMLKGILIEDTKDNDEAVLAEVEQIKKEENSDRVNFLMKLNSESQSNTKAQKAIEKVKTKQVKIEKVAENKDQEREIGD